MLRATRRAAPSDRSAMFRLGYNTNGLAHHRVLDALDLLSELGYEAVSLTPDVGELDLYHLDPRVVGDVRRRAEDLGLELTVETGARFVLDPRRKHRPTLLEELAHERERRIDFLRRSIDFAHAVGAHVVSLWSGAAPEGASAEACWQRLRTGLVRVLDHARPAEVTIALEPEPGMFVDRPDGYLELCRRMGPLGSELGLCLDVGHLLVTGDVPVAQKVRELAPFLRHVHLDDIAGGVHEHVMFGRGDLDLAATMKALVDCGYSGVAAVELSRDSHRGAAAAEEAMTHLVRAILHKT